VESKRAEDVFMGWSELLPDVLRWRDSCNVYAVLGDGGALIVDAGSGAWLADGLAQLPVPARALVLTHYFRDHAGGAAAVARAGIPVYAPEGEEAIVRDPREHFRRRSTSIVYDNIWDLYAPVEPTPLTGVLRDYERTKLAGIELQVLPLPGATITQVGVALLTPRSGRLVAFCGETIHSPGRLPRIAPLQYDYNDLLGAVNVAFSIEQLLALDADVLLPSLGEPIAEDPGGALRLLRTNLVAHVQDRPIERTALERVGRDAVEQVGAGVWRSTQSRASAHFVVGRSGRGLALDYGYWHPLGDGSLDPVVVSAYSLPERRRALLHSLEPLRAAAGVSAIDAVIPTHYHDDHVCGIPLLQRLLGVECWAPESFAQLLAEPAASRFPCTWPQPIRVDRTLALDAPLEWDGIRFHFGAMSGHTRFSALIGWELDGVRYVHVGDQYAPIRAGASAPVTDMELTYVYANGAFLDSYRRSAEWVTAFRPDVILSGHSDPLKPDAAYFERLAEYGREFEAGHRRVTALEPDEAHFGLDAMAGWLWPYHARRAEPGPITFKVTVRNPLPRNATLELCLAGPDGWRGSSASVAAPARGEVVATMTVEATSACRRQPVTVELRADGRPFGQVIEALVTVDGD
jgi:glyoxylase-like metal-dependent hydrolase (beta-lactamase superfamily II)